MFDTDDVRRGDELIDTIYDHAVIGILADGFGIEDIVVGVDGGANDIKTDDFEVVWIDDGAYDLTNWTAGLNA